jgi:hypothetical protein
MAIILFSIYLWGVLFSKIRKKYDLAVFDFSIGVESKDGNSNLPTKYIMVLLFFWVEFVVLRLQITLTH